MNRRIWLLFYLIALVAVVLRFAASSLVFFGPDQGLLQLIADRYFEQGAWPLVGLVGTKSIYYGPVPSWIYIGLRAMLPTSVDIVPGLFFLVSLMQCFAVLYLIVGLRHLFSQKVWLILSALILSSPALTYFSRQIWDNTFLIVLTNIFAGTFFRWNAKTQITDRHGNLFWILGGACAGASISVHLMALPLVLGIVVACATLRAKPRLVKASLLFVLAALVFVGPYVYGLVVTPPIASELSQRPFDPVRWLTGLRTLIVQWSDWLTWNGFLSYFSPQLGLDVLQHVAWLPSSMRVFLLGLTVALQIFLAAAIGLATVRVAKSLHWSLSNQKVSALTFTAVLGLGHIVMAVLLDATAHIHYFQAVWWTPLIPLGLWLDQMADATPKKILLLTITCLSVINVGMSLVIGKEFVNSKGYPELGPSFDLQRTAVLALCRLPADPIAIAETASGVTFPAIRWIAKHEHEHEHERNQDQKRHAACSTKTFVETPHDNGFVGRYRLTGQPHIDWEIFIPSPRKDAN